MTEFEWKTRTVTDELTGEDRTIVQSSGLWVTKKNAQAYSGKAPFTVNGKTIQMYVVPHEKAGQKTAEGKAYPQYKVRFFATEEAEE